MELALYWPLVLKESLLNNQFYLLMFWLQSQNQSNQSATLLTYHKGQLTVVDVDRVFSQTSRPPWKTGIHIAVPFISDWPGLAIPHHFPLRPPSSRLN